MLNKFRPSASHWYDLLSPSHQCDWCDQPQIRSTNTSPLMRITTTDSISLCHWDPTYLLAKVVPLLLTFQLRDTALRTKCRFAVTCHVDNTLVDCGVGMNLERGKKISNNTQTSVNTILAEPNNSERKFTENWKRLEYQTFPRAAENYYLSIVYSISAGFEKPKFGKFSACFEKPGKTPRKNAAEKRRPSQMFDTPTVVQKHGVLKTAHVRLPSLHKRIRTNLTETYHVPFRPPGGPPLYPRPLSAAWRPSAVENFFRP